MSSAVVAEPNLQPHQKALFEAYSPGASRFIAVSWPPGMGINFTAMQIAGRFSRDDEDGRALLIVPYLAMAEQLVQQLLRLGERAVLVDGYLFRELIDRVDGSSSPWEPHTIYVLTPALLQRDSVVGSISRIPWAFVAVLIDSIPGSKAFKATSGLLSAELTPRVLWISADRSDLDQLPRIAGAEWQIQVLQVNDLKLAGDTNFRPVEFDLFVYQLSEKEKGIDSLIQNVSSVHDLKAYLEALRVLKREWPSSAAALENALRRLRRQLTIGDGEIGEGKSSQEGSDASIDGLSTEGRSALASFVNATLDQLEGLESDSKYRTLIAALDNSSNANPIRACVLTRYRSTAAYLQAALENGPWPVHSVHAGMTLADRESAFQEFSSRGGLLVCTPTTMTTAPILSGVTALFLYDVPATKLLLRIVGSLRRGPAEKALRVCAISRPDDLEAVTRLSEVAEIIRTQG